MRKRRFRFFGILFFIFLGLLIYFALEKKTPSGEEIPPPKIKEEAKKEEKKEEKLEGKLLFRLTKPGQRTVTDIYTIDLETQDKKKVFTDFDEEGELKIIDGLTSQSIFATMALLGQPESLWEIKIDGTGKKGLILEKFNSTSFSFNEKNGKIAFILYDQIEGNYHLATIDKDGRNKKVLRKSSLPLADPVWLSQDRLAFIEINEKGGGTLKTINLDGSNLKEIKKSEKEQIYSLSFSPSASLFAYIKAPKSEGPSESEVYICDLKGNEKRLTNDKEADFYPVLSSDGKRLAFAKKGEIWVGFLEGEFKPISQGTQPLGFIK